METSHFPHSALWGSERSRYQYSQWIADSSSRTIKLLPVPPPSLPSWHRAREIATAARNEKSRGRRLIWDRQFLLYFSAVVLLSSDPFLPKKKTNTKKSFYPSPAEVTAARSMLAPPAAQWGKHFYISYSCGWCEIRNSGQYFGKETVLFFLEHSEST